MARMEAAAVDLCLPLLKFSYAESDSTQDAINWNHYTATDLWLLLRGDSSGHGKLFLSVVERTTTKESVDISSHVNMARTACWNAQQTGASIKIEQLPIFGITKDALLALRYRTSSGRARRIQLRLQSATQCHEVVDLLRRRGIEFQDQRPTTSRPSTTSATSGSRTTELRPRTTQLSSIQPVHSHSSQSPFHPPSMKLGSLSQHPPEYSQLQPSRYALQSTSSSPVPAPFRPNLTRDQLTTFDTNPRSCSTANMSSLPAPRTGSEQRTPHSAPEQREDRFYSIDPHAIPKTAFTSGPFLSDAPGPPPWTASSSSNSRSSAMHAHITHQPEANSQSPFAAPGTRDAIRNSSRPNSALELPPLQRPRIASARPASAAPLKTERATKPQISQVQCTTGTLKLQPLPLRNSAASATSATIPTSATPDNHGNPSPTCNVHPEQSNPGKRTTLDQQSSMSMPRLNSLMDAPHEVEEEAHVNEVTKPPRRSWARMESLPQQPVLHQASHRDAMVHSNAPGIANEAFIQTYAAQRPQDREAALNKFMMDHLADAAFATLCADVENCWRRIALGL